MRLKRLGSITTPAPQHGGADQGRHTRIHMHHSAPCKIECTKLVQPAAPLPHPMGDRGIDHHTPQRRKYQQRGKTHALHHSTHNQAGSDDGKGSLKQRIGRLWQMRCQVTDGEHAALAVVMQRREPGTAQIAQPRRVCSESQRVSQCEPGQRHDAGYGKDRCQGVDHILAAHQPCVEKSNPWQRH